MAQVCDICLKPTGRNAKNALTVIDEMDEVLVLCEPCYEEAKTVVLKPK